jgi:glycosidase
MKYRFATLICAIFLFSCAKELAPVVLKPAPEYPPHWAQNAIWYQIMVERFHNGDSTNDPSIEDIQGTYPGFIPKNWTTTPWTQNWYKEDDYFKDVNGKTDFSGNVIHSFDAKTALRRYGGDLQGVLDKLDYLHNLGVNAIHFNPINDAPSLHKYDARHWRHVDANFGPDPLGDRELIANEDPTDPSTWVTTSADALFLELIQQAKAREIRIILDYSWNHTGHTFWAWQDILKNQQESEYADWYRVKNFDDPTTPENEFEYEGWFGVFDRPEIQETQYADHSDGATLYEGNILSEAAKHHIFAVTRRWLDPNGDGDVSDGVDGFSLDAAAELPLGFWREYRTYVKSINPQAYLAGEIWSKKWPNDLLDSEQVLQGDVFDAVKNYRWYRAARQYFSATPNTLNSSEFVEKLNTLTSNIGNDYNYAMMNMSASHDSPRLLTSLFNNNKYKFNAKAAANMQYKINKPNARTIAEAKLLLAHQFTYIGAPQIWAGDEMGMWGSDAPHNRKPLIWPEFTFENENGHPLGRKRPSDTVKFNQDLFDYYQFLIMMRRANPVLSNGDIEFVEQTDGKQLLSYRRFNDHGESAYILFNMSDKAEQTVLPAGVVNTQRWQVWKSDTGTDFAVRIPNEQIILAPQSVMVIVSGTNKEK